MVTPDDVRRLALALPGAADETRPDGQLVFGLGGKGFAWTFMERVQPKKPRVPQPAVLAVRCEIERKEMLIAAAPGTFFDDDHYRGYPAVLVRLAAVRPDELGALLAAAAQLVGQGKPGRRVARRRGAGEMRG